MAQNYERLGGHAHTHDVDGLAVDSGFIVHNDTTYPLLTRLFRELDDVMDVAWGLGFAAVAVVGYKVPRRPGEPRPGDGPWAVALHPASELLRRRVRVVGYAEYAARTSGFFPLPPRRSV
jgi:phytoene dehydrogenase-like protein